MSRFLGYAWVPLIGAFVWGGIILALLILWLAQGHQEYQFAQTILYISDVAAIHGYQQAIFIAGGVITAISFTSSVILDRWLRRRGRLPQVLRRREKLASDAAIICAILGSLSLVVLTCFNDIAFSHVHWTFTVLFVVFVALSAIFTTIEEAYLHGDYPSRKHLRRSTYAKTTIVTFEVLAAIAFGALQTKRTDTYDSASAVLEWTIAFVFAFYLLTFVEDLRASVKTSEGYARRHPEKANLDDSTTPYHNQSDPESGNMTQRAAADDNLNKSQGQAGSGMDSNTYSNGNTNSFGQGHATYQQSQGVNTYGQAY